MLKNFKNRLELFKKKNELRGIDMADAGGISPQSVSAYTDSTLPRAEVLAGWADKFNLNINWLLTGEGEMLRDEKAHTSSESEIHDTLKRDYAARLEELNALKSKVIDLQEELLAMHRGRRQERRSYGVIPSNAPGGGSAAPLSHHDSEG